jgi:hypothetical protein
MSRIFAKYSDRHFCPGKKHRQIAHLPKALPQPLRGFFLKFQGEKYKIRHKLMKERCENCYFDHSDGAQRFSYSSGLWCIHKTIRNLIQNKALFFGG